MSNAVRVSCVVVVVCRSLGADLVYKIKCALFRLLELDPLLFGALGLWFVYALALNVKVLNAVWLHNSGLFVRCWRRFLSNLLLCEQCLLCLVWPAHQAGWILGGARAH